jgi:hypothetical protein
MRSALYAVRNAFKNRLAAQNIAVYDTSRKVNDYPYVILAEQTENQDGSQGEFGIDATITIDIYNSWASDFGVKQTNEDLATTILQATITKPHSLVINGFDMPVLVCESVSSRMEQNEGKNLQITSIRFRMRLFEQ